MKKIKTWLKLDQYFIDEENIRAIKKKGKTTIIERMIGDDIVVNIEYEKLKGIVITD